MRVTYLLLLTARILDPCALLVGGMCRMVGGGWVTVAFVTESSFAYIQRMYLQNSGELSLHVPLPISVLMVGGLALEHSNVETTTRHYIIRPHLYCRVPSRGA